MQKLTHAFPRRSRAFTLVEMLVVIAIIGVLAAILMPALTAAKRSAKINAAKTEINSILSAIKQYETEYGSLPCTKRVYASAADNTTRADGCGDFTFGTTADIPPDNLLSLNLTNVVSYGNPGTLLYKTNNSEIIAILMDLERYGNGLGTQNANHVRNTHRTVFLDAKQVNDTSSPGVGLDGVFRDPWGNPYIISLDIDGDGQTVDGFYGKLIDRYDPDYNDPKIAKRFIKGTALVWSFGPDGKISGDPGLPELVQRAINQDARNWVLRLKTGENKDNILSWQ